MPRNWKLNLLQTNPHLLWLSVHRLKPVAANHINSYWRMIGMGWDDSLLFPLEKFVLESSKRWTCQTIIEQCTFLLRPMQSPWEKRFFFSDGMGRQGMWLIPTVKANAPKALQLSAISTSNFSIQYLVSRTQMPLSDLLNYSKLWPLESKTASWSRQEFGTSNFRGWAVARWNRPPVVEAMDMTCPSAPTHAGRLSITFPWKQVLHSPI